MNLQKNIPEFGDASKNFSRLPQNRSGRIPPYQARQLIAMIEKYGDIK